MRTAFATGMFLLFTTSMALADEPKASTKRTGEPTQARAANNVKDDKEKRRCAFLGRFGCFTLIGSKGTAAYMLGNEQYIADLASEREDPNWWIYRAIGNGDPWTTGWAFARRPQCGKYTVLRFSNGAWRKYEQTDAWGTGLGESGGTAAVLDSGPTNQELLDKLRDIEGKLQEIQPGVRPSLEDLENQIKAKP